MAQVGLLMSFSKLKALSIKLDMEWIGPLFIKLERKNDSGLFRNISCYFSLFVTKNELILATDVAVLSVKFEADPTKIARVIVWTDFFSTDWQTA